MSSISLSLSYTSSSLPTSSGSSCNSDRLFSCWGQMMLTGLFDIRTKTVGSLNNMVSNKTKVSSSNELSKFIFNIGGKPGKVNW